MSGWDSGSQDGHSSGSGPEHEPSEERGRAAWSAHEPDAPPPWASAETRTDRAPSPWATPRPEDAAARAAADRRAGDPLPPSAGPDEGDAPPPWAVHRHDDNPPPAPPPWASAETYVGVPAPPVHTPPVHTPPPTPAQGPPPVPPQPWAPSGPTPPYQPVTGPRPGTGSGPGRLLLVLVVIVVAAGSGLGVWYFTGDRSTATGAGPSSSVGVSTPAPEPSSPPDTPSDTPSETPSDSTPASSPPTGYRTAHDPVGYTLDVPTGWTRRQKHGEKAAVVFYESPSDGRQLQIFELSESTPAESLDMAENDPGYGYSQQPGYQAEDRASGDTWVELSYRYDDKDKGARRVVDHRFQAADGTLYAIRASGPEDLSAALVREPLDTALASFCPADSQCGQ
ncbi:hypothetical protein [Streptomyces sp. NPDC058964]|uniref:hypothetical protein n=1 Tax=Streptomyces sp. NPDC058964 TaxID=3346681 RepID=UPI0036A86194